MMLESPDVLVVVEFEGQIAQALERTMAHTKDDDPVPRCVAVVWRRESAQSPVHLHALAQKRHHPEDKVGADGH